MRKHVKVKLSLLGTIGVSLLAVSSAAVSTFAWFQAKSQVNVSAQSADPVQITVSAPDAISITPTLYAYDNNGTIGYSTIAESANQSSFTTAVTAQNNTFTNLYPGRMMSFMIKLESLSEIPSLSLTLTTLNTTNSIDSNRKVLNEDATAIDQSKNINITDTIQMYASWTLGTYQKGNVGTYESQNVDNITQGSKWSFGALENQTKVEDYFTSYIFYTIEFLDSTHYLEYEQITQNNSTTYKRLYSTPTSWSNVRYFKKDNTNGNSTCYSGLSFSLSSLNISG